MFVVVVSHRQEFDDFDKAYLRFDPHSSTMKDMDLDKMLASLGNQTDVAVRNKRVLCL